MRVIKTTKIILWLVALLILIISFYVYSQFNGTPWEKKQQEINMEKYLEKKYQTEFVISGTSYNSLSDTYQAYAHPKKHKHLLFMVQEDIESGSGYSDTFSKVLPSLPAH